MDNESVNKTSGGGGDAKVSTKVKKQRQKSTKSRISSFLRKISTKKKNKNTEDQDELETAHRERMELMAAERKRAAEEAPNDDGTASVGEKLQFLLAQSEVFAHFLAGTVAAAGKKKGGGKKKGSRGKNRMTEAEEDAQLLKTAESKRSVIRLDKQVK